MSLYNEETSVETITTTTFDRSYKITVQNPHNGTPSIEFEEETIKRTNDGSTIQDMSLGRISSLKESFTGSMTFDLLNPLTGDPLGTTATDADLQVLLYSLYFHLATERDGE